MLRRNLVIGSLVAGAFLLPNLAQAVVTGTCVNCHTMHATNGNGTDNASANAQLLLGTGCVGCHTGDVNDSVTGRAAASFNAPQISDTTNVLSGGYFQSGAPQKNVHNITDDAYYAVDTTLGVVPPGSSGAGVGRVDSLTDAAGFTCADCHDASGGHHGTTGTYRLLTLVTGTAASDYGVQNAAVAAGNGNRSGNAYNSTSMNTFCASCHGDFHGAGQTNGQWIRHPTDVATFAGTASIQSVITPALGGDQTPVGTSGLANAVMCLSCHVPHGGPRADLLSFTYSNNVAGGTARSVGCETCHSYGTNGM